jgi:hypothetical protein
MESLSPHRVLPMGEDPYLEELRAAEREDVDGRVKTRHDGGAELNDLAAVPAPRTRPYLR